MILIDTIIYFDYQCITNIMILLILLCDTTGITCKMILKNLVQNFVHSVLKVPVLLVSGIIKVNTYFTSKVNN